MQRFRRSVAVSAALMLLTAGGCGTGGSGKSSSDTAAAPALAASRIPLTPGLSMVGIDGAGEPVQADESLGTAHPASWARSISIAASPSYRHALARNAGRAVVVGLDGEVSTLSADIAPASGVTNLAFSPDERWLGWQVEREGIKVAELVAGAARGHAVTVPDEVGSTATFAGWTVDNRVIVAAKDALWTVRVDGTDAKRVSSTSLRNRTTGGGIQNIAHSLVQVNPTTGDLAYTDTDPSTRQPRIVIADATFAPKRTVPNRSLANYTPDGRYYAAQDPSTSGDVRLICSTETDECRNLPQYTLLTPWPNGLLPMQPALGAQQITVLVDPATAQQVAPPAVFSAVEVPRQVLPTALMQLLSKTAPTA